MTIPSTQLAAALVAGERSRTPGQEQVTSARNGFNRRKDDLWKQYSAELKQAKAPLKQAVEDRALERLSLEAAATIQQQVGGAIDIPKEAGDVATAILQAIKAQVEVRSNQITTQREEQHSGTINLLVDHFGNIVTALLAHTVTDPKRVNTELLKNLIGLVIDNELHTQHSDILPVFSNNRAQAVQTLTEKVLLKFKPKAATETDASAAPSS